MQEESSPLPPGTAKLWAAVGIREVGTPRQFQWLKGVVASIFFLNVLDGLLTVYWIFTGQATEANPLMDNVLHISPGLFMGIKLGLVGLGSWLLWRLRQQPAAVISIFALFGIYYLLLLYHLNYMDLQLAARLFGLAP
jgi:hypothetical protein